VEEKSKGNLIRASLSSTPPSLQPSMSSTEPGSIHAPLLLAKARLEELLPLLQTFSLPASPVIDQNGPPNSEISSSDLPGLKKYDSAVRKEIEWIEKVSIGFSMLLHVQAPTKTFKGDARSAEKSEKEKLMSSTLSFLLLRLSVHCRSSKLLLLPTLRKRHQHRTLPIFSPCSTRLIELPIPLSGSTRRSLAW